MEPTWLCPGGGSFLGNTNQPSLERDYLCDSLWREEDHSRQLVEEIKRNREKIGNNSTPIEKKKELRKKINSLNRRLKRCQKSIEAISGNLATLGPQTQVITQSWPVESDYTRLEAFHFQTVHDLQSQIQQLSLAVQNPFSPSSSINLPVPTTPVYPYSPVYSEGCSPLYSPFYGTSFQPFNYISGQAFQSPLRRYSAHAVSPTSTVQQNDGTHPVSWFVEPTGIETLVDSQPVALEPKPRTRSLPLTYYNGEKAGDESPASDDCDQELPHRHSS